MNLKNTKSNNQTKCIQKKYLKYLNDNGIDFQWSSTNKIFTIPLHCKGDLITIEPNRDSGIWYRITTKKVLNSERLVERYQWYFFITDLIEGLNEILHDNNMLMFTPVLK